MPPTAPFTDFFYSANDGLELHARVYDAGAAAGALPVVCLPGLTRNARDFHELALHLSAGAATRRRVIAFDYRGRGLSARDRNWRNYDPLIEAGDVMAGLAALGIGHAAFVGTSRGGLIVFALAAMRPALLKAVVLNDIGPVVEGAGLVQIRAYLERAPRPRDMAEAAALQKAVQGTAFPALTDADWQRMAAAFYSEKNGRLVADFDPALLKTLKGIDLSKPLPQAWPQFLALRAVPLMAIRGENSSLLSADTLREMANQHPDMRSVTVSGQGHAPLLETAGPPDKIAAFLDSADRKAR
ncbi:MAG: alpha/beta hydrolase [Rhizobiales bacterium 68-8]|nr:MAG: alpha/beta hydrolase [Rhizobiales bacterium 68-8]